MGVLRTASNVVEDAGPIATVLTPVLDTYREAAVAVVGCHAAGIQRESCELDVVVVASEARPFTAVRFGDEFFDLHFITQKEALNPPDPEAAVSLAQSKPIRDRDLVLSTSLASNQAMMAENTRKCARLRLTSCLKALARAEESLAREKTRETSYWLLTASYDFARSWLYGQETIPAPSHLLKQLKEHSKGYPLGVEAFTKGAGLGKSSRKECAARLEAILVLYDLLGTREPEGYASERSALEVGSAVVKRKAEHFARSMEHAESYSFLGGEVARVLLLVSRPGGKESGPHEDGSRMSALLTSGGKGLLSDALIRDLGLERQKAELKQGLEAIKGRVAGLARKT